MLMMSYKYSGDFREGALRNANRGGENVATGTLMGALLGAELGFSNIPKDLVHGLYNYEEIKQEGDTFIRSLSRL